MATTCPPCDHRPSGPWQTPTSCWCLLLAMRRWTWTTCSAWATPTRLASSRCGAGGNDSRWLRACDLNLHGGVLVALVHDLSSLRLSHSFYRSVGSWHWDVHIAERYASVHASARVASREWAASDAGGCELRIALRHCPGPRPQWSTHALAIVSTYHSCYWHESCATTVS